MFFEISKFLRFLLVSPISWMAFLMVVTLWVKRKRGRRILLGVAATVFLVFTNNLLVDYVQFRQTRQYVHTASLPEGKTWRVAIVMGGFGSMNRETGQMTYVEDRADRLWEAVRLYREGRVRQILITGDPTSIIQDDGSSTAELFLRYMEQLGVDREAFILEQQARNTRQNAVNTAMLLKQKGIEGRECLLITSATHMDRSVRCFAKVGVWPDVMAVNLPTLPSHINHRAFYPEWAAALKWETLLNEKIGDLAYRLMGYV